MPLCNVPRMPDTMWRRRRKLHLGGLLFDLEILTQRARGASRMLTRTYSCSERSFSLLSNSSRRSWSSISEVPRGRVPGDGLRSGSHLLHDGTTVPVRPR